MQSRELSEVVNVVDFPIKGQMIPAHRARIGAIVELSVAADDVSGVKNEEEDDASSVTDILPTTKIRRRNEDWAARAMEIAKIVVENEIELDLGDAKK